MSTADLPPVEALRLIREAEQWDQDVLLPNAAAQRLRDSDLRSQVRRILDRVDRDAVAVDEAHLRRQREWSEKTFGPGPRVAGIVDHIRRELTEIEDAPSDLSEWVDVVILALDGAWRSGASPVEILRQIKSKQAQNEGRAWPDWRLADPNRAIEHVRVPSGGDPR